MRGVGLGLGQEKKCSVWTFECFRRLTVSRSTTDSRRNQGSRLSPQQGRPAPCTRSYWTTGSDNCAVFPRSAMLLSPLVYPAGTLCHYTNSICQQSAADKPRATILASATSGLGPCCLAKQLLDGLRASLLLAMSTTLE